MKLRFVTTLTVSMILASLTGCSSDESSDDAGTPAPGSSSGGSAAGGSAGKGGGTSTGGMSGKAGSAQGGAASGGKGQAGESAGGKAQGGESAGGSGQGGEASGGSAQGGEGGGAQGGSAQGGAGGMTPAPKAKLRIAHLSPDAPAVDVCAQLEGSDTFAGPLLDGALPSGLAYPQVSQYLELDQTTIKKVRLVAPDATSCDTGLVPDIDLGAGVMLMGGNAYTVGAVGELNGEGELAFKLAAYADNLAPKAGEASISFVHASPGTPAVDVKSVGEGGALSPVFTNTAFPAQATAISIAGGLTDVQLAVGASPFDDLAAAALVLKPTTIPADAAVTVYAIGNLDGSPQPLQALACVDTAAPANGLSNCAVLEPQGAFLRVAHLSPDAPEVDVCLQQEGSDAFIGPAFAPNGILTAGLAFGQVSQYLELPAGKYVKVRAVAPGSTDCATAIADFDVDISAMPGGHYTAAAVGELGGSGDTAIKVVGYADNVEVAADKLSLSFVHASPGTPAVDVALLGPDGAVALAAVPNVAFPDAAGPLALDSALTDATIAVGPTGFADKAGAAIVLKPLSLGLGETYTVYAIGNLDDMPRPLAALACAEHAAPVDGLSACSVLPELNAMVRIAHLAGAPPVDVCVSPDGVNFMGPVLDPTVPAGIKYGEVAAYIEAPPGGLKTVRFVNPGATDCTSNATKIADFELPQAAQLVAGEAYTAIAHGEFALAEAPLTVSLYADDVNAQDGKLGLRFIHACAGVPAVDVGLVASGAVTGVFTNVSYPDGSDYAFVDGGLTDATVAAGVSPFSDPAAAALTLAPLTLTGGQNVTVIAIGVQAASSTAKKPLEALACFDTDMTAANGLAKCQILPPAN